MVDGILAIIYRGRPKHVFLCNHIFKIAHGGNNEGYNPASIVELNVASLNLCLQIPIV